MRKFLILAVLILILCSQAFGGDSLKVAIRQAKNVVGTTDIVDSVWNEWANEGYQYCLTNGYAYVKDTVIIVKPYVFPDSDNYVLPSDFYEWVGATVISNTAPPSNMSRNIKLLIFGQEHEIGLGEGSGAILFATITEDSIRFHPNPARYDTVLLQYYSHDAKLADTDVMKGQKVYTPIVADYILARYFLRMQNTELASFYRQLAEAELAKITQLRRKVKADYIIPPKILEK